MHPVLEVKENSETDGPAVVRVCTQDGAAAASARQAAPGSGTGAPAADRVCTQSGAAATRGRWSGCMGALRSNKEVDQRTGGATQPEPIAVTQLGLGAGTARNAPDPHDV